LVDRRRRRDTIPYVKKLVSIIRRVSEARHSTVWSGSSGVYVCRLSVCRYVWYQLSNDRASPPPFTSFCVN